MRTAVAILLLLLLGAPALAAAQEAKPAAPEAGPAAPKTEPGDHQPVLKVGEYRIGPEDVLEIAVWQNPAMSRTVPVRPDGRISLPLLNDVQAAGRTPMELRAFLIERLREYMPSPDVSVIVTDVRSFKASIIGEVAKPGSYQFKSWTTVLDILAQAGGFGQFASRTRMIILRPDGTTMKRIPFNYNRVISGDQENFYLLPGDIVLVP